MRIISGKLGGRRLVSPPGDSTRPAMAQTREALFSMLESRCVHWPAVKVLDLFAGTGSLAFEALSRGASHATLVDSGQDACAALIKNADILGIAGDCRIIKMDALRFLRQANMAPCNIVFVDPPYRRNLGSRVLQALAKSSIIAPGAVIAAELEKGAALTLPPSFRLCGQRQFGQTLLHIWVNEPS